MVAPRLTYKIKYDNVTQKLHVTVVSCEQLPKKSDPYVRVYLMPGTHMELKTKHVKNNANPVYNDEFSFVLKPDDVRRKTIVFQVYDKDTFTKDDGLGEVQIPLWNIADLAIETTNSMDLAELTRDANNKPKLWARRPDSKSFSNSANSTLERQSFHTGYNAGAVGGSSYSRSESYQRSSMSGGMTTSTSYQTNYASSSGLPPGGPPRKDSSSSSSSDEDETRRTVTLPSHGGMSLHELNNRLEKYIQKINLNPDSPNFNITVETVRDGSSVDIRSMSQYQEYESLMREYMDQEEHLAKVDAEIDILSHENQDYQTRLQGLQLKISQKKQEISDMERQMNSFENEKRERETVLAANMVHNARVSVNKEKAGFINTLNSLQWQSRTTKEYMEDEEKIRDEIKKEYDRRLQEEIEKIRYLYNSYEGEMRISIQGIFEAKINELRALRQNWSAAEKAEVDDILAKLNDAKRQIIELEKRKLDLSHEERHLADKLEEDDLKYKCMLDAKKNEKRWLEEQFQALYLEYSKYESDHTGYDREVNRYKSILTAEHSKRVSVHAEKFYDSRRGGDDSSSSSSSSSDDEDTGRPVFT